MENIASKKQEILESVEVAAKMVTAAFRAARSADATEQDRLDAENISHRTDGLISSFHEEFPQWSHEISAAWVNNLNY